MEKAKLGRIRLPEEELKEPPKSVLTNIWRSVDISFNAGLLWDPGEKMISPFMNVNLLSGECNLATVYLATPKMSQFNMAAEYLATPNMSQVPRKYQKEIELFKKMNVVGMYEIVDSVMAGKVNMALHGSVVCNKDPFMDKEGIAQRTAVHVPTEVNYYAKVGLQIGSEVFPYAYTNAHTIGYEVVSWS